MRQINYDCAFIRGLLPKTYTVQESKKIGSVHCKSSTGIRKYPYINSAGNLIDDAEDDEKWSEIFEAIENHFGNRFQEVFHNTCAWHVDFTVYLKA